MADTTADNVSDSKQSKYFQETNPKYDYPHKLDSTQTYPGDLKTINFKQDYIVIIRKKPYYAATAQQRKDSNGKAIPPEENYLRVYQVNNFTGIRVSTSVFGKRPGSCSVTIRGGERVVCAEAKDQDKYGWQSWDEMLNGWLSINESGVEAGAGTGSTAQGVKDAISGGQYVAGVSERVKEFREQGMKLQDAYEKAQATAGKKWSVGEDHWAFGSAAAGVDFKNLLKTREAKYGWRFAEKADWEPMDEVWIFGKSRSARQGDSQPDDSQRDDNGDLLAYTNNNKKGEFKFLPIFFGYIDSVTKTYTANKGGLLITIQASDHLKLLELSRIVNTPTLIPGITPGGGLDIRYNKTPFGLFDINQPLHNQKNVEQSKLKEKADTKMYFLQNIFGAMYPYEIVQILGAQAGIPDKYLTKRIEQIKEIPFVEKIKQGTSGDLFVGEMKSRLGVCNEAAEKLFLEFFADEEGNLVLKIPSYALGANKLRPNNMGIKYPENLIDEVYGTFKLVDEAGKSLLTKGPGDEDQSEETPPPQSGNPEIQALGVDFNFNAEDALNEVQIKEITIDEWGKGDHGSLYDIAQKYLGDGKRWGEIAIANGITDPTTVKPGDKLIIHLNEVTSLSTTTTTTNTKPSMGSAIKKAFDSITGIFGGGSTGSTKPPIPKTSNKAKAIPSAEKNESGPTLSERTDKDIPAIKAEYIISFTLVDSDKEIYNMFEIGGETMMGIMESGSGSTMTQIRRAIPDVDSIQRFGLRPHPGIMNTPLVTNVYEAEIMGLMMLMRSQANRYSGSITVIDDSAIKVGNPIRVHLYDEHPMKEITTDRKMSPDEDYGNLKFKKDRYPEQAVFYVTGIERNIDPNNVSSMTLQVRAGRMMGQTSIYDICLPLYKFYYDEVVSLDFTKSLSKFQEYYDASKSEAEGHYKKETITSNFSFDFLFLQECGAGAPFEKKREFFYALISLNPELFGIAAQLSDSTQIDRALAANVGNEIKIPKGMRDTVALMKSERQKAELAGKEIN